MSSRKENARNANLWEILTSNPMAISSLFSQKKFQAPKSEEEIRDETQHEMEMSKKWENVVERMPWSAITNLIDMLVSKMAESIVYDLQYEQGISYYNKTFDELKAETETEFREAYGLPGAGWD